MSQPAGSGRARIRRVVGWRRVAGESVRFGLAQRLRQPARSGGFQTASVRPIQQCASAARHAKLTMTTRALGVCQELDHTTTAHGASARVADQRRGDGQHTRRDVRLDQAVALRPTADQLGTLGSPLAAQLCIQRVLSGRTRRRPTRRSRGVSPRPWCGATSSGQPQPAPSLQVQIRGLDVVQPANSQRGQSAGINQVAHRALGQVQHLTGASHAGITGHGCRDFVHASIIAHAYRARVDCDVSVSMGA